MAAIDITSYQQTKGRQPREPVVPLDQGQFIFGALRLVPVLRRARVLLDASVWVRVVGPFQVGVVEAPDDLGEQV